MKPEEASTAKMEEIELDPWRLFQELGMLVIEGRIPESSLKGRIEGPHCLPPSGEPVHVCKDSNEKCHKARGYQHEMHHLWETGVPMCVEVMMCCRCETGSEVHDKTHGKTGLLLERWTVSVISRRCSDVGVRSLLQAVRSYLYFSQLSAWLNLSKGKEPRRVMYRVAPPGEFPQFPCSPDVHTFPVVHITKSAALQVTVSALPRQGDSPRMYIASTSNQDTSLANDSNLFSSITPVDGPLLEDCGTESIKKKQKESCYEGTGAKPKQKYFEGNYAMANNLKLKESDNMINKHKEPHLTVGDAKLLSLNSKSSTLKPKHLPVCDEVSQNHKTLESPKVLFTYGALSRAWNSYAKDCFSLAEELSELDLDKKFTGDLSLKELKLLPEQSRVKFTIGHSLISKPNATKAIRHLDFSDEQHQDNGEAQATNGQLEEKHQQNSQDTKAKRKSLEEGLLTSYINKEEDLPPSYSDSEVEFESTNGTINNVLDNCKLYSTGSSNSYVDDILDLLQESSVDDCCNGHCGATCQHISEPCVLESVQKDSTTLPSSRPIPTSQEKLLFRRSLDSSSSAIFNFKTGLPMQSSPAPVKKISGRGSFGFDSSLNSVKAIKKVISCSKLEVNDNTEGRDKRYLSTSAPASTNCLLGNFEESLLNGRLEPAGVVDGFSAEIGASGLFCPKHIKLPVTAYFFTLSDDNAPSPYLGHINLSSLGKRGYHVPKKGTVQVTLFNPENAVVKMFVVMYDLIDMPSNCQTFLRQRTFYVPVSQNAQHNLPSYLRYLIHLRFSSSKSGKIYLHTDIRLIFARDKFEFDSRIASYELRSCTERPDNPKFSPKR